MNDLSDREQAILAEWTRSAFDCAVAEGWIVPPWRPSEEMYPRMHEYCRAGLTPSEGAQALFGTWH
jgi:hypothetical protein